MTCDPLAIIGSDGRVWNLAEGPLIATSGQNLWGAPPSRLLIEQYIDRAGGALEDVQHGVRPVTIRARIDGGGADEIRATAAQIVRSLSIRGGMCRILAKNGDIQREIVGVYRSGFDPNIFGTASLRSEVMDIVFDCPDPYWYSTESAETRFASEVVPTSILTLAWSSPVPWYLPVPWDGTFEQQPGTTRRNVSVDGDVETWPTWTITGPMTQFEAGCNGAVLAFDAPIAAGETLTISTRPKRATVDGVNRLGDLRRGLGNRPFPFLPGVNDLAVNLVGGVAGQTSVTARFTPRFEASS